MVTEVMFHMRLKELRVKRNLYQKDVASMLGIDRTTYAKYETGDSEPNLGTLVKISEIFDVSTDYLLGKEQKERPIRVAAGRLSDRHRQLIDLYDEASPDLQSAAVAVLKSAGVQTVRAGNKRTAKMQIGQARGKVQVVEVDGVGKVAIVEKPDAVKGVVIPGTVKGVVMPGTVKGIEGVGKPYRTKGPGRGRGGPIGGVK